jgi:adenylate cyclase
MERKLAAILSADVKGYSRLMGEDEEATIRTLTAYREVMARLIQQHRGRVVDAPGDNLLAEFPSVVEAVQCAVAVQRDLKARNAELPPHRRMEFRIGINLGDVIAEGERLYGDGVNIAARLEGLAEAGGICISGTVYDQIKTKLAFGYESLGEQAVKNIAEPVRVYRVQMEPKAVTPTVGTQHRSRAKTRQRGGLAVVGLLRLLGGWVSVWRRAFRPSSPAGVVPSVQAPALALPDKPSIAVLPFVNMSGDPEQEYFSDGMTEDLITDLSKLSGLFVIARNSVFTYKGQVVMPAQVSRELGVRYVLEGSVRKADNRVRITAQLVDATTGYHRWAERYDRPLQEIFALQDEITQKIVTALKVQLTQEEQARFRRFPTHNLEAYDALLRGLESANRYTPETNAQARRMFERAIELDPQYAAAYVSLAWTYWVEWVFQWSRYPQTLERAFALAQQAVALDDALPVAHMVLGTVYLWNQQHDQAITAAERAIALDPNEAGGYDTLAEILTYAGRPQDAIGLMQTAMRLDPHYPFPYLWNLGHAYYLTGQYAKAIAAMKNVLIRRPDWLPAHLYLVVIYSEAGQQAEARAELAEVRRIRPGISLQTVGQHVPYKDPAVLERLGRAWHKAMATPAGAVLSASDIPWPASVHLVPPAAALPPEVAALSPPRCSPAARCNG